MAGPDPQANEPQTRPHADPGPGPATAGVAKEARGFQADPEPARKAVAAGAQAVHRTVDAGADQARRTVEAGAQAAQTLTEAGQETGRRMTEAGRRGVDLWRQSVTPFAAMTVEMNRWFEDLWRQGLSGASQLSPLSGPSAGLMQGLLGLPTADLRETPDAYMITVELAGLSPQDVEVALEGDNLVVSGERRDEAHEQGAALRVSERRYGRFERRFPLARDVERDQIQAAFQNGLLRITLGRRHDAGGGRRRIEVAGALTPTPRA